MPEPGPLRALRAAALAAAAGHVAARVHLATSGRFFACEDDPYRAYLAYLIASGEEIIGRFWLPGQMVAMAAVQRLGVPVAWSGPVVATLALIALLFALIDVTRRLAPEALRPLAPWAALLVWASSPMTVVAGQSALGEPLECALLMIAAAAVVRRADGGSRIPAVIAAASLGAATWVRYEAWAAALLLPGVLYVARRRTGGARRDASIDALIGGAAILGPLAWLFAQHLRHGDALGFVDRVDQMSQELTGAPSALAVLSHRAISLARWAPATLLWGAVAARALAGHPRARAGAVLLATVSTLGIAISIAGGREHAVFIDRLVYGIEVAVWPLAALGLAWVAVQRPRAGLAAALITATSIMLAVIRPAEMMDTASLRAGMMLRREGLAAEIGAGALLVERVPERPPFGWATLAVLWGEWDRVIFGLRRVNRWDLVEPARIHATGRAPVPIAELRGWLDQHHVTAAWLLTPGSVEMMAQLWPDAKARPIGAGVLVVRP